MRSKLLREKLLHETAWSLLAKGISAIFFIGLNVFLARHLGPDRYGTWSYFYSILSIVLLLSYFGINGATRKYAAQFNTTDKLGAVLKASLKLRFYFSFLFVIIFFSVHGILAGLLSRPDFELLFIKALPLILFAGMVDYFKHTFEGLHKLKFAFVVALFEHGLKLILTILILLFMNGLVAVVYSFNLAFLVASVVGFYFFYNYFYKNSPVSLRNYEIDILKYSLPIFVISFGFAAAVELDVLMLGILTTESEVGIYAAAKQIIVKLPHLALAISLGAMPVFAKLNSSNKEELKMLFNKLLLINTIIFGSIGLLILTTSWYFIPLIYGLEYVASVVPLMILVLYLLQFSYSIFLSSLLDYQGMAAKRAVNLSITLVLNILLNIILIPRYGAIGAAIGTSVSYMPYVFLNWLEVRKILV